MVDFDWVRALSGGILIGISATILLAFNGRIAGISSIVNGAIWGNTRENWRWLFLIGMLLGATSYENFLATSPTPISTFSPLAMILGGLLVGFGTAMSKVGISGDAICGLGRLSPRSGVAVLIFFITASITVFIIRHG